MKKVLLTMIGLFLLVFALSGISYAWQGRMGGMGDPFGLVADESDYLIHPAKIAKGEGVRFYGDYRFTYTGVTDWDFKFNGIIDASGQGYKHDALVGAATPLGPGRMGLFFEYAGNREKYDGNYVGVLQNPHELKSELDNFALRLLYGLPLGSFNLGGEVQLAYRQEENKTLWHVIPQIFYNYFGHGNTIAAPNIRPYMIPYDSKYWEALFKGSLDGKLGPLDLEFTLRGGFIFGGHNQFKFAFFNSVPGTNERVDQEGNVSGWRIGGDLWLRYLLKDGLTLPFLVRIDYQEKTRDGDGQGVENLAGINFDYQHKGKPLQLEIGGGLDKELASSTRIAAGLYYNYLQAADAVSIIRDDLAGKTFFSPATTEHRVLIRLAGEHEISPAVILRMGMTGFYGWVQEHYRGTREFLNDSLNGFRWGIGASLGGTIKFKPVTLEPFITGGYQSLDVSGRNFLSIWGNTRTEWFTSGGFSVLYDL